MTDAERILREKAKALDRALHNMRSRGASEADRLEVIEAALATHAATRSTDSIEVLRDFVFETQELPFHPERIHDLRVRALQLMHSR